MHESLERYRHNKVVFITSSNW